MEETIYPIHRLMQNWKLAHESMYTKWLFCLLTNQCILPDIDKTMASITKVLDIFDTAAKVEEKINDGYVCLFWRRGSE